MPPFTDVRDDSLDLCEPHPLREPLKNQSVERDFDCGFAGTSSIHTAVVRKFLSSGRSSN